MERHINHINQYQEDYKELCEIIYCGVESTNSILSHLSTISNVTDLFIGIIPFINLSIQRSQKVSKRISKRHQSDNSTNLSFCLLCYPSAILLRSHPLAQSSRFSTQACDFTLIQDMSMKEMRRFTNAQREGFGECQRNL